jgi:hypothetical protein
MKPGRVEKSATSLVYSVQVIHVAGARVAQAIENKSAHGGPELDVLHKWYNQGQLTLADECSQWNRRYPIQ